MESLLNFLRCMKRFRLDIRSLLAINLYHYPAGLVTYLPRHTDCVVKEMCRVKIHTFPERMLPVQGNGMDTVESKDVDLRHAVCHLLANQEPSVTILLQEIRIYRERLSLMRLERLILNDDGLPFSHSIVYRAYELCATVAGNMLHIHRRDGPPGVARNLLVEFADGLY